MKRLWTVGELVTHRPFPAPKWLIDGLLPGGGWTLCIAKGKVGKSILVTQMLHALSVGEEFFGKTVPAPVPTVLLQADTPPAIWQDELAQAGFPKDSPVHTLFLEPGVLSGGMEKVMAELEPLRPCYVAFDALDSLFVGLDVNNPDHAKEMLSRLRKVAGNVAFTLIHHSRKGSPMAEGQQEDLRDAAAGSRVLLNRADHVIFLRSNLGPIEVTGRLASYTYEKRNLSRLPGGMWRYVSPVKGPAGPR